MNIVHENKKVTFSSLGYGDVFKSNGDYFIKIHEYTSSGEVQYNAIRLATGARFTFQSSGVVECVNCELVIK